MLNWPLWYLNIYAIFIWHVTHLFAKMPIELRSFSPSDPEEVHLAVIALADLGACAGARPLRVQILSFWYTKFSKHNCLESQCPLRGRRPPYGKSWIRHCIIILIGGNWRDTFQNWASRVLLQDSGINLCEYKQNSSISVKTGTTQLKDHLHLASLATSSPWEQFPKHRRFCASRDQRQLILSDSHCFCCKCKAVGVVFELYV